MGKNKTAVDYLHSEYKRIFGEVFVDVQKVFEISDSLVKAKEIEKQQIINAHGQKQYHKNITGEQYYYLHFENE